MTPPLKHTPTQTLEEVVAAGIDGLCVYVPGWGSWARLGEYFAALEFEGVLEVTVH